MASSLEPALISTVEQMATTQGLQLRHTANAPGPRVIPASSVLSR